MGRSQKVEVTPKDDNDYDGPNVLARYTMGEKIGKTKLFERTFCRRQLRDEGPRHFFWFESRDARPQLGSNNNR